ncbi:DUF6088 family protein [uncultured Fibrella sp.]|uniref:DUF6088 family protein n=1 Tax=uncultured Fibrella sp. TaxID=1284596 RepID=UPI0035CB9825
MTVSETITRQIEKIPEAISFGYADLNIPRQDFLSAAKALERLQKKGLIQKLSKGKFYKPKQTPFGEKKPDEQQILKPYLYQHGKRIAYITGGTLYNQLGLTTQVPATIQIASRDKRISINTGALKATPVKSYVDVTEENYQMLGFLDAMKDLKRIPDVDVNQAIAIFQKRIERLTNQQVQSLIDYALCYPPRVRALLGALLESLKNSNRLTILRDSLNPLTHFDFGLDPSRLPTAANWNIR